MPFFGKSSSSSSSNVPATTSAPQGPSMLKEMAATAGSVAVGSAVGHVVGHALTGALSGGSQPAAAPAATAAPPVAVPAPVGVAGGPRELYAVKDEPCSYEIKRLLACAVTSGDLNNCKALQDVYRNCMLGHTGASASASVVGGDATVMTDSAPTLSS